MLKCLITPCINTCVFQTMAQIRRHSENIIILSQQGVRERGKMSHLIFSFFWMCSKHCIAYLTHPCLVKKLNKMTFSLSFLSCSTERLLYLLLSIMSPVLFSSSSASLSFKFWSCQSKCDLNTISAIPLTALYESTV